MWKNEMDTETPAGLNEICKVFVVRYLVWSGLGCIINSVYIEENHGNIR